MNKIKTIIVDDEKKAREGLHFLLKKDPLIEVLAICKNGLEAIECLNNYNIQLVFLDIQMPGISGFEVLNSIPKDRRPFVIFVTAFDDYALKAFEYHALDYLLKPFTNLRFETSLEIAKRNIYNNSLEDTKQKIDQLLEKLSNKNSGVNVENSIINSSLAIEKRIVIKTSSKKIVFIHLDDIVWIEAFDYYIKIHTKAETHLIRESLKRMESNLPATQFIRVHRSSIVNTDCIKELVKTINSEYKMILKNGDILKVSRNYRQSLDKFIKEMY